MVIGLSANPSLKTEEVLLYVYGTISPFLNKKLVMEEDDEESDSDKEEEEGFMNGESRAQTEQQRRKIRITKWLPVETSLSAVIDREATAREEVRIEYKMRSLMN